MSTTPSGHLSITRQELYDLVWSKPMVKVAQEFGVSDRAVAKYCKRQNIRCRRAAIGKRRKPEAKLSYRYCHRLYRRNKKSLRLSPFLKPKSYRPPFRRQREEKNKS